MVCDYRKTDEMMEQKIVMECIGCDFRLLTVMQKYEIFEIVSEQCKAEELFRLRWIRAPNASVWLKLTERFTITTAVMSMVGFVIGLGDRHPSNLMVQRATGNVVHIDFGESFESTILRKDFPEKVQFRLTRMIEKALEASTVRGFFTNISEIALNVLRMNRWSLSALIAIFVSEPLQGKEMKTDVKQAVEKVGHKMEGRHEGKILSVRRQVAMLIDEAANPMNYIQHYPGWCPFW
jgi:phosphatidylinositol kinase/protein kinase (PI-3  family)